MSNLHLAGKPAPGDVRRIAVVTAGLSEPSSTRLLADLLADATRDALGDARVDVVELRPLAHAVTDALLTGFPHGELAPAIETLREQLGDAPSPDALTQLGEVEQAARRLAAARWHYAQASALEKEGLREGAGYDAGVTLNEAEHGDADTAVTYGRRAWHSAPSVSSADAYSWALYRAGRIDAATRLSAEAMRLGSRDPEFLYHAGVIAKAGGSDARARRLLSALLEQAPRFNPLYAPRADRALAALGG